MNIYHEPEDHGLQPVAEHDFSDGAYRFDIRVVWYHKETNRYYTARDSGCSCPSPFEDYNKISDLEQLENFDSLIKEAKNEGYGDDVHSRNNYILKLEELNRRKTSMKKTIEIDLIELEEILIEHLRENVKDKTVTFKVNKDCVVLVIEN